MYDTHVTQKDLSHMPPQTGSHKASDMWEGRAECHRHRASPPPPSRQAGQRPSRGSIHTNQQDTKSRALVSCQ